MPDGEEGNSHGASEEKDEEGPESDGVFNLEGEVLQWENIKVAMFEKLRFDKNRNNGHLRFLVVECLHPASQRWL